MAHESRIDELPWADAPLDRLRELASAREYLDWLTERSIRESRPDATWENIADALGSSRQAVHRKYAHLID